MVLGFNHNVMYKGEVFHVQTEDSGVANPHIVTLLYRGGVILCSKKTSYADIVRMENLEVVVEELMKEQHKYMMRRLKTGEFDERAFLIPSSSSSLETQEILSPAPIDDPVADFFSYSPAGQKAPSKSDISMLFEMPAQKKTATSTSQSTNSKIDTNTVVNLDDAILNFFGANENK
jgi:hypothetical protein